MLLALLQICSPGLAAEVSVSGEIWDGMRPDRPEKPEKKPGPWVSARDVRLTPSGDAVRIRAEWTLQTVEPGWVDLSLVDSSVRVDSATLGGQRVALKSLVDGNRHLIAFIDRPMRMVLEGEVVADLHRGLKLDLLEAPVGRLQVDTPDPVVKVLVGEIDAVQLRRTFWTGAPTLEVTTSAQKVAKKLDTLVVGAVGLGVTVSDGAVATRGRIQWRVVRGKVETLVFSARGAGADLAVTGPRVADWSREGDRVTVQLQEPADARVEIEVAWSTALPDRDEATLALPSLTLEDVFRSQSAMQIARDGDREIVPDVKGWEPVPGSQLPEVADGLVTGTPASAWVSSGKGEASMSLLRFRPVSGPPTIVDVAAFDGALSQEGRLLLRAHYTVRNDRGAFLRITPPPGAVIVSARVGGEPARVARDGEIWLVPLLKSVETVQGLLDFPVDLILLSDGVPFEKREERRILLPAVDAEVAVTRVSLSLPIGWENKLDDGEGGTVNGFTEGEGLTYGFKTGDQKVAEADALFQSAVGAWMDNDFDVAQGALDDLRALGGDNENVGRLQSNIDLVLSDDDDEGEGQAVAMGRRVKEQAKARASGDVAKQEVLLEEADQMYWSGNYAAAEEVYRQALDIGENLEKLEKKESVEQEYANSAVFDKLSKSSAGKMKNKAVEVQREVEGSVTEGVVGGVLGPESESESTPEPDVGRQPQYQERTVIDFDGVEVTGELVKPDGQLLLAKPNATTAIQPAPPPPPAPPPTEPVVVEVLTGRKPVSGGAHEEIPLADPKPLEVVATSMDVVIPTFGETVRYQHLLLPAGQGHAVPIRAKKKKKKRGNP